MNTKRNLKLKQVRENVLAFDFEPVVRRLRNKGLSKDRAQNLFHDVKRFLWMCAANPNRSFVPPKKIDFGWHTFLEFTGAYSDFCETKLGRFVHHVPKEALPVSFAGGCRSCASCSSGASRTFNLPTGGISFFEQTLETARAAFGRLSPNWK